MTRDLLFAYSNRYRTREFAKTDPHLRLMQRRIDQLHRIALRNLLAACYTRAQIWAIRRGVQAERFNFMAKAGDDHE